MSTSIKLNIFDGVTPMLDEIVKLNYGSAREALSIAGDILRKNVRNEMKRSSHHWEQEWVNGKHRIWKRKDLRELGLRKSSKGGMANPDSMSNFITSYMGNKSTTVVVGGAHRDANMVMYRDGKPSGSIKLKGISKATQAILNKLNSGEINEYYTRNGSDASAQRFSNARYVGYKFMEKGYASSKSAIEDAMTNTYSKILGRAVDRANVHVREVKFA